MRKRHRDKASGQQEISGRERPLPLHLRHPPNHKLKLGEIGAVVNQVFRFLKASSAGQEVLELVNAVSGAATEL